MILGPNEVFAGTFAEQEETRHRLEAMREGADLGTEHPGVTFVNLPAAVNTLGGHGVIVRAGLKVITQTFAELGITDLLPHDRVWIGKTSVTADDFGGFHRPLQGYRHWQAGAVITLYGDLTAKSTAPRELRALDLIRAYAHDGGGHWSSYRRYRLTPRTQEVRRTRYGYNARSLSGAPYSLPHNLGDTTTRNLGVIMEGGTDLMARQITAQVADMFGITEADFSGVDRFAFRDLVGTFDASDQTDGIDALYMLDKINVLTGRDLYLARMAFYDHLVSVPYAGFLKEIGGDEAPSLHRVLYRAMLTGNRNAVSQWLTARHGCTFAEMFKR